MKSLESRIKSINLGNLLTGLGQIIVGLTLALLEFVQSYYTKSFEF
jgi:hypothetical protein